MRINNTNIYKFENTQNNMFKTEHFLRGIKKGLVKEDFPTDYVFVEYDENKNPVFYPINRKEHYYLEEMEAEAKTSGCALYDNLNIAITELGKLEKIIQEQNIDLKFIIHSFKSYKIGGKS